MRFLRERHRRELQEYMASRFEEKLQHPFSGLSTTDGLSATQGPAQGGANQVHTLQSASSSSVGAPQRTPSDGQLSDIPPLHLEQNSGQVLQQQQQQPQSQSSSQRPQFQAGHPAQHQAVGAPQQHPSLPSGQSQVGSLHMQSVLAQPQGTVADPSLDRPSQPRAQLQSSMACSKPVVQPMALAQHGQPQQASHQQTQPPPTQQQQGQAAQQQPQQQQAQQQQVQQQAAQVAQPHNFQRQNSQVDHVSQQQVHRFQMDPEHLHSQSQFVNMQQVQVPEHHGAALVQHQQYIHAGHPVHVAHAGQKAMLVNPAVVLPSHAVFAQQQQPQQQQQQQGHMHAGALPQVMPPYSEGNMSASYYSGLVQPAPPSVGTSNLPTQAREFLPTAATGQHQIPSGAGGSGQIPAQAGPSQSAGTFTQQGGKVVK